MVPKILVTGAAGYIGDSVLATFISHTSGPIRGADIHAAVRTDEQVQQLLKLGINVVQVDLSNEAAVLDVIIRHEIDIVVHTAISMQPPLASNIIKALSQRRDVSGVETYIIHAAVTSMYSLEGGWPFGEVRDTDPILEKEKQIEMTGGYNPVRAINIVVTDQAKANGVTSFNVAVPYVYGRGSGEWRKLSVAIPAFIRTSITLKRVYKFDKNGSPPAAHISDLCSLFVLIVEKIMQSDLVPSDEIGYYFAMAHRAPWWEVMDRLAAAMYTRGLVIEQKAQIWPSDEMAAESLGWPLAYLEPMGKSSGQLVPVNPYRLGWQPKWDQDRFLNNLDDEIEAVLELDTVNT